VVDVEEKKMTSKKTGNKETYCKLVLQQNNDTCECVVWPEQWANLRGVLLNSKNKLVVFSGVVKYSDYAGVNNVWFTKNSKCAVL